MAPIAQLILREAPFRPAVLDDIALLTVFAANLPLHGGEANGDGWLLRAYPSLLAADFPDWPDIPDDVSVSAEIEDEWEEHFGAHQGLKLGGWPTLLQDQIFWAPFNEHPANPEYAFQIAAVPKAGFGLRGDGIWYFGRGTGDARDVWTFENQLM
ncbi:MAG: hypothetical protein JWO85_2735 [Candidatus Eremiobacteraeota bacterium]|jgi:hypothetical protein|nr:hypothetical protein [Candidatus Eremiobacteraeota bacterium]